MLVPFSGRVSHYMAPVIGALVDKLSSISQRKQMSQSNVPTIHDVWAALQCEMALEKFTWGKLQTLGMSYGTFLMVKQYAVNVGPGHNVPGRSKTDELGFLALSKYDECTDPLTPLPPFGIWTTKHEQVKNTFDT